MEKNLSFLSNFKKLKNKKYIPNSEDIIIFDKEYSDDYTNYNLKKPNMTCPMGILPIHYWKSYNLKHHPGLIIISNVFTQKMQKFLIMRSLEYYINFPNKTNLDAQSMHADEIWKNYKIDSLKNCENIKRLRWATMGFHHNWDSKVYNLSVKSEMPEEIVDCCRYIANAIGYDNYNAEASIVNFYHEGNTLSGHTDHSEQDQKSPIISISFGCSAIFMIGGKSKEDHSSAVLINNGDVVIMSELSRLCYHAVPRILMGMYKTSGDCFIESDSTINGNNFSTCKHFKVDISDKKIQESQMNINVTDKKYNEIEPKNHIKESVSLNNSSNDISETLRPTIEIYTNNAQFVPIVDILNLTTNKIEDNISEQMNDWFCFEEYFKFYCNEKRDDKLKVIKSEENVFFNKLYSSKYDWNIFNKFLLNSRININVRQVKPN